MKKDVESQLSDERQKNFTIYSYNLKPENISKNKAPKI